MTDQTPLYPPVTDCQETFGVQRGTVYRWAQQGKIHIHRVGDISLLNVSEMQRFIESGGAS